MKLAVVGGGSTYTPELVDGLGRLALPVDEVALIDPDAERLDAVAGMCRRILSGAGHPATVSTTGDLDAGLTGAATVIIQLRVGGQQIRAVDETLPLPYGRIGNETAGVGGLAKALRTVPVVLRIAERVAARAAPGAWIVDFTNPVGIMTRALLDAGHRALGLCNVAIGVQRRIAALLGLAPDRVGLDHVGLNHLTWVRAATVDGVDVLPGLLDDPATAQDLAGRAGLPVTLLRELGAVPSYYLRFFYAHDKVLAEQRAAPPRAERVTEIEHELLRLYRDPAVTSVPDLLGRRGGAFYSEAALGLLGALGGTEPRVHVVNVRNGGTLPFLPDEAVIEVPARVTAGGATPVVDRAVEPLYAGLIGHVAAYEELALRAALHGGEHRVAAALLAHPLVGQAEPAEELAAALVRANVEYLPWATR